MNPAIKTVPSTAGFRRLLARWLRRQTPSSNTGEPKSGRVVAIGFDGSRTADATVLACMSDDGRIHVHNLADDALNFDITQHIGLLALQQREADHIARYEEWIRHQRYLGRMHVLNLIDDAWARYGWIRPKVARR